MWQSKAPSNIMPTTTGDPMVVDHPSHQEQRKLSTLQYLPERFACQRIYCSENWFMYKWAGQVMFVWNFLRQVSGQLSPRVHHRHRPCLICCVVDFEDRQRSTFWHSYNPLHIGKARQANRAGF